MKKTLTLVALAIMALSASAQNADSVKVEHLQDVVVMGVKANKNAPFAVTNVNSKQLSDFAKTGQELPFLFAKTPGVLAWTENGLGIGPSYMSIRGASNSRINVSIDGVSLNSPEDQQVFWANMNSYAAILGGAQIQRGVGSSTNGDGAFGGTLMLYTKTPNERPSAEVNFSYGSYNTWNAGLNFSTGMLWNHLVFDGAYHETNTDGYLHGTSGRSGSYYGGLTWYSLDRNLTVRYKNIGNFEKMGQGWNGVIAGDYDGNVLWDDNGVPAVAGFDYKQLHEAGYGQWNSLAENIEYDYAGNLVATPYAMKNGGVWNKATDNFWQNHNLLSFAIQDGEHLSASATLRYTRGYGYYSDFKYNSKLSKFGFANYTLADNSTLKKTDFVRKKGLDQNTYGLNWNINYKNDKWNVLGGMAVQVFDCNHFGYLTYIKNDEFDAVVRANGDYKYYDSDATKTDGSAYVKATYDFSPAFNAFADLQYRKVWYVTDGINDRFVSDGNGGYVNHVLDINKEYDFFNPKAGLSYHKNNHEAYASVALSHREPQRDNFTDNGSYPAPKSEQLLDYELGYTYASPRFHVGANLYYMDYKNQFVMTGALSDIGEPLTTNIDKSYRMGVELTAGVKITSWLDTEANVALSQNKVKDFTELVDGYDADWNEKTYENHYDNTTLAYSPSIVANWFLTGHYKGFNATWHTGYVGKQYLDNSESDARSIAAYCVSNFSANYTFNIGKAVKQIVLGANVNNIFNTKYAANGFVWYQYYNTAGERLSHNSYMPSAGTTVMGNVTVKF